MKIVFCGKWPPIQGGVCRESYEFALSALQDGAQVTVVTNADSVEQNFRMNFFSEEDDRRQKLVQYGDKFKLRTVSNYPKTAYIPGAIPYLSLLLGGLHEEVRKNRPDVIVGSYFEPYGVAAAIVGKAHGIPVFVRHAGSDIGRLANCEELHSTYSEVLGDGATILTVDSSRTKQILKDLKIRDEHLHFLDPQPYQLDDYHLDGMMDINAALRASENWFRGLHIEKWVIDQVCELNRKVFEKKDPVIGIFGKAGESKGTFDLAEGLRRQALKGTEFTFLPMCSGQPQALQRLYELILSSTQLSARIWRDNQPLPDSALAHATSPVRALHGDVEDAVAFLENRFSVDIHSPAVPWQIIDQSALLLLSGEQYATIKTAAQLVDGKNTAVIGDPRNPDDVDTGLDASLSNANLLQGARNLKKILNSRLAGFQRRPHHPMYAAILEKRHAARID